MAADATGELCRVSVVATRGRFDVALPTSVPLAYLLPTLLRQAGEELAETGTGHGGWGLQRLGGWPFDTGQSMAALGIADGEVLYLRPRHQELPPPVFDDVAEAIGATLDERTRRWQAGAGRVAGRVAAGVLLTAGVAALGLAGPPWPQVAAVAGLVSVLLLIAAAAMSRAAADAGTGTVLGCAAMPYAFATGLCGLLPAHASLSAAGSTQVLGGASAALIALVLAIGAVGGAEPAFLAAGLVGLVALGAGIGAGHTSPAGVAALADVLVFLCTPLIPALAYRLARLPTPFLPATADELRQAGPTLSATELSQRSLVADRYVTALLAAVSLVAAGSMPFLLDARRPDALALIGVIGLLALLRSRLYSGVGQRVWLLVTALTAAATGLVAAAQQVSGRIGHLAIPVAIALLALVVVALAARVDRPLSPVPARALDIVEVLCAVATIPLALDVLGVYAYVRSLSG
jgi:type VII secretion integral membrane protein EccD